MENKRNRVLLCLGSNWDKEKNMERAAEMLRAHLFLYSFLSQFIRNRSIVHYQLHF